MGTNNASFMRDFENPDVWRNTKMTPDSMDISESVPKNPATHQFETAKNCEKILLSKAEKVLPEEKALLLRLDGNNEQDVLTLPKGDCAKCHEVVSGQVLH